MSSPEVEQGRILMSEAVSEENLTEAKGRENGGVLIVDDNAEVRAGIRKVLSRLGYRVDVAASGEDAEEVLSIIDPDLILLDVDLPGKSGLELLPVWRVQHPNTAIVMISGAATISDAIQGLKDGAYDFLEKPFKEPSLLCAVRRAISHYRLQDDKQRLAAQGDTIVGKSPKLINILQQIKVLAPSGIRILVTGESGTGKELIAGAIHQNSSRKNKRFLKVNCGALTETLLESELFGHVKGAYTGAAQAKRGLFEAADGGTLFMDEVGELTPSAQTKLLRVLQDHEIIPVGSTTPIKVDVRVIAATNRDLSKMVEAGSFREDLFYRLNVGLIHSPSLRDRVDDIPLLVEYFATRISDQMAVPRKDFSEEVYMILKDYRWPGNIRELRNIVERMLILGGHIIVPEDLPSEIRQSPGNVKKLATASHQEINLSQDFKPIPWEKWKWMMEKEYIIKVLRFCNGNISEAARVLEVRRPTIHKWLNNYQIQKSDYLSQVYDRSS